MSRLDPTPDRDGGGCFLWVIIVCLVVLLFYGEPNALTNYLMRGCP